MIKSMTGFGKATAEINGKKFSIEIKTLNSKQADVSVRMPSLFKEKEFAIRSLINQELERGKIDFSLGFETLGETNNFSVNKDLFKKYYNELAVMANELGQNGVDLFTIVSRMPDVFKTDKQELEETEWQRVNELIIEAINATNNFRITEGETLQQELLQRTANILSLLKQVDVFEPKRLEVVKERIATHLAEAVGKENINKDRFEQELIFYIEKFDVTEEKTRLTTHCNYFIETIKNNLSEGRKLGFITQEMGREINTLGSKANNVDIQMLVVQMKDELEKIKEQTLNVL
ncbi:MAG: YicC family protein [Flavobacteriales bacterium]|nr:YicC family protein [Flavobacteriales bacterium]